MASLDFERLLSRDYRPARVTRMVPNEKYDPALALTKTTTSNQTAQRTRQRLSEENNNDDPHVRAAQQKATNLVLQLVSHTPEYQQHVPPSERHEIHELTDGPILTTVPTNSSRMMTPYHESSSSSGGVVNVIPPQYHEVELGDWESKIDWHAYDDDPQATVNRNKERPTFDARAILNQRRNPYLDTLTFDDCFVLEDQQRRQQRAPLILELGVAGRSVATQIVQAVHGTRPPSGVRSEAYQRRLDAEWGREAQPITSTAELSSKHSLSQDKAKMEAMIAARQERRAKMAMAKTSRVSEAMGTLSSSMGGSLARGRRITSSLMGPGGSEKTGRPARHNIGSLSHDAEYVEQLDLVQHHGLIRFDTSKVALRQYHRPKLPLSIVRTDLSWQLQVRYVSAKKTAGGAASGNAVIATAADGTTAGTTVSYAGLVLGAHNAGALSKAKLRAEADLSPSEGQLVLLEYSEERPPVQLTKGMAMKIVNYYRGDKTHCPVSAGGGDRPVKRKRGGGNSDGMTASSSSSKASNNNSTKTDRLPRLEGPNRVTTITDWVGKLPKKNKERTEQDAVDVLPEGVSEILHPKVHGPFIGEVEEGATLTGLISNLFVAPMFRHEPELTDFLMILTPPSGASRPGQREWMGVILRDLPSSVFTVGQTEPRVRLHAPNSQHEKNFLNPFVAFQIARAISRAQGRDGHGLRFDEVHDQVLPSLELPANALRQRLKQVAVYDKMTQIWTTKQIGFEDYPGVEALGKSIAPEGIAAFETACAAARRLVDLGVQQLFASANSAASIGITMMYLTGQLNAARELHRKTKKLADFSRTNKSLQNLQFVMYEKAASQLESIFKTLRQKHDVAKFIYEELQLAPWHVTAEFLDVHKKGEGSGMMKLTGLGDPSGQGEGFSFLREGDSKPIKSVGNNNAALDAQIKKITGTNSDLRKLHMHEMASLLRSYGMPQEKIATLKRWDRVHCIRDLSTKAASDGIGDGLERFARGEKMKLSEQKQMYRDRIQVIWKRQIAALSASGEKNPDVDDSGGDDGAESRTAKAKQEDGKDEADSSSDEDDDDDDLAAALEDEMLDGSKASELVNAQLGGKEGERNLGQLRAAARDAENNVDARELAALKRQREEERVAQEGFQSQGGLSEAYQAANLGINRKVVRKKIVRTHPDGRQTTRFKFIILADEVGKIMERLQHKTDEEYEQERIKDREFKYEHSPDEKPSGHAMYEDEDDFDYSSKSQGRKNRGTGRRRAGTGRNTPKGRAGALQFGKLKTMVSKEERMRKRKREEEELDVYTATAKRKSTNNRRERGSIRERRPHVIFAEKLEAIRAAIESRPLATPFAKPVSRKFLPRYYETISNPIDLATIRDKINRYEYRFADQLVRDFELMKQNAIKFNGETNHIAQEAMAIYEYVRDQVNASRDEFASLEEAVQEQMSGKKKKKTVKIKMKKPKGATANVGGISVNLGDLPKGMNFDGIDSDSGDDSYSGLLNM